MDINLDELDDNVRHHNDKKNVWNPSVCIDYFEQVWCPEEMRFVSSQIVGSGEKPKKIIALKDLNK